jgi:beta-N-acetylhexosaminidase
VDLEQIAEQIQSPEFAESAQGVAEAAVTLVRNPQGLVPLRAPSEACFIAMAENRYSQQGRKLVEAVQQRSGSARVLWLDPQLPRGELLETAASLQKTCGTLVVAPFVNASAYRGNVALLGAYPEFVQSLMKSGVPVILAAFGSPYLLKAFPDAAASIALCSSSIPSEIALVKALWGETGFRGKLPVSIPGFAQLGEGIQLGRRPAAIHGQDK